MKIISLLFFTAISLTTWFSVASAASSSPAQVYQKECSDCHIAYPAAFLSTASWDAVLNNLDKHFGDNAEIAAEDLQTVKTYLQTHNYDQSRIKRRYKGRFDTPGTPLRVTKTRFFRAIHDEVSSRLVTANPKVKTFAHCEACHRGAANGNFDEDEVRIPR